MDDRREYPDRIALEMIWLERESQCTTNNIAKNWNKRIEMAFDLMRVEQKKFLHKLFDTIRKKETPQKSWNEGIYIFIEFFEFYRISVHNH